MMEKRYMNEPSDSEEDLTLLLDEGRRATNFPRRKNASWLVSGLFLVTGYLLGLGSWSVLNGSVVCRDPSLGVWSPANAAVRYRTIVSDPYFFNRSPYMGTNVEELDTMWLDLYDFGTSAISSAEASKLANATLPTPKDSDTYVVELGVFHHLHCLNMIRKTVYPDEYPEMWAYHENGTVNHNSLQSFHLDHCIDALRQSLMCTADVTPYSFHFNKNDLYHMFPQVWAARTCRDFDDIKSWATQRQVEWWKLDMDTDTRLKSGDVQ